MSLALLLTASCGDEAPATPVVGLCDAADAQIGETAYNRYCALCHGLDGEGYLGAQAVALGSDTFLKIADDAFLVAGIVEGRPGTRMAPYGTAFSGPLSDQEACNIVAYMRGWQSTPAVDTSQSVQGDASLGKPVYDDQCATCHGIDGEGTVGCSLNNEVFLRTASDGFLRQSIVEGRPDTIMAGYTETLTDQEIDNLVVYIRSFSQ